MTKSRKYAVYKTLAAAVTRSGIKQAGVTASLLLKTFIENDGILTAKTVEDLELCDSEGFKAWRDPLIKAGWLLYDHEYARAVKKGSLHQPGKKLISYLNKERMRNQEIATKKYVDGKIAASEKQSASEMEVMRSELNGVKDLVKMIIARLDDPYTDEKFADYSTNPEKMLRLISNHKI